MSDEGPSLAPTPGGAEHDPAGSGLAGGLTTPATGAPAVPPTLDLAEVDEPNRVPGGRARAVLTYLARQIVEDPDGVSVQVSETRGGVRLELLVADGDMGRVIGRKGRVAQAIRAVVRAAGARDGLNVTVDIVD
ncbi:MAG TPA: KH domain-containing protein [Acidimicrobiales bacterium]|nr:KH domain-containing protein [Acidimicrobiales bacterium]